MSAGQIERQVEDLVAAGLTTGISMAEAENALRRAWIQAELGRQGNNQCAVAASLGVHRNTVVRKMKELSIAVPEHRRQRMRHLTGVCA